MIARPLPAAPPPSRTMQHRTRRGRRARARIHPPVAAVLGFAAFILVPLLAYVAFSANLTAQSFAIARVEHERAALLEESQRLDDRIARLRSPEHLAALAAKLKMHDPHVYAIVDLPDPKPQPKPAGFALLSTWFSGVR